jgi:hypothetical protein
MIIYLRGLEVVSPDHTARYATGCTRILVDDSSVPVKDRRWLEQLLDRMLEPYWCRSDCRWLWVLTPEGTSV